MSDVSFSIEKGETLAVIGESGAGKSATGMAIMDLIPPAAGVEVGGAVDFRRRDGTVVDLRRLTSRQMRHVRGNEIAMIFQEPMSSLNPVYRIGDQIAASIMRHQHRGRRDARRIAAEMLDRLGIPDPKARLASFPHQISGGMAQRVMIAMALACRPSLLIADEPTTALDVTVQAQLLDLLRSLQNEFGMAIMFITHNLGVAAELADRIVVMYAGRVVEHAPTKALFANPRMPYTRGLLASIPRIVRDDAAMKLSAIPGEVPNPRHQPRGCAFHPRCGHTLAGLCDTDVPPLEQCGPRHGVRCVRWRDLVSEQAA
ncbi:MAG TPA: ABC transporter ATP-binding protein [Pseudolabrys sp.]|nr:ABC transporter ATP-binding protein [Pseudolabrys sp.]